MSHLFKSTNITMSKYDLKNADLKFKIITCGDTGTGKSHYVMTLPPKQGEKPHNPVEVNSTIGVDFASFQRQINNKNIRIQVWDTAGQEQFVSITRSYYRDIIGVLLFFNLSNRSTFIRLSKWLTEIKKHSNSTIPLEIVIVGNFLDKSRQVSAEEAIEFAKMNNCSYVEISAKNHISIEEPLKMVCTNVLKRIENNEIEHDTTKGVQSMAIYYEFQKEHEKSSCCKML